PAKASEDEGERNREGDRGVRLAKFLRDPCYFTLRVCVASFRSCGGCAAVPATTTWFRPALFALYMAASAEAISSSGVSPPSGYSASPMLTVSDPGPRSCAA